MTSAQERLAQLKSLRLQAGGRELVGAAVFERLRQAANELQAGVNTRSPSPEAGAWTLVCDLPKPGTQQHGHPEPGTQQHGQPLELWRWPSP